MRSVAGFVLALIGGIFTLLAGIFGIILLIFALFAESLLDLSNLPTGDNLWLAPLIIMVWFLLWGILTFVWAAKINNYEDDNKVRFGGIMALITGIFSLNILTLIGGILGIVSSGNRKSIQQVQQDVQEQQAVNNYLQEINAG
mgnify:FL=1